MRLACRKMPANFLWLCLRPTTHACRERNDGLYRVITYLCYKMLEELIVAILISVVVACIVFYGVQLKGQWVTFWLTYLVTLSCGVGEPCSYPFSLDIWLVLCLRSPLLQLGQLGSRAIKMPACAK